MNRIYHLCLPAAIGALMLGQISIANAADNRKGGNNGGRAAAAPHAAAMQHRSFAARPGGVTNRSFAQHRSFQQTHTMAQTRNFNRNRSTLNHNAIAQSRNLNRNSFNRGNRNLALRRTSNVNQVNTANAVTPNAAAGTGRFARGQNNRSIASNQFAFRSGNFHRGWNPGRTYVWNHHHWRNYGGVWAVYDAGWPADWYGYPYPFAYDNTVYYDGDVYDPGNGPAPAAIGNNTVADVQSTLANAGYNPGPADGVPGPQTEQAIAQYQQDHGMAATGQIDSALLDSLGM